MDYQDDEILFSNFTYNPDYYYFMYIGDLKAYGLNIFLQETLNRRVYNKEVRFIAIIPDICIQYNYANLFVINPEAGRNVVDDEAGKLNIRPLKKSCRIKYDQFISAVSANKTIRALIEKILQKQNQLYISLYENIEEMTLDEIDRVTVLGPNKSIAKLFNSKVHQYKKLQGIVPLADHHICHGLEDLLKTTSALRGKWRDGIFVSTPYSAAGTNSAVTQTQEETASIFTIPDGLYIVARYIPHQYDPTVLAVVANENDVYIAGIADQVIVGGNRFVGSKYPTVLPLDQQEQLKEYTRKVGRVLGQSGYRGIFGCDYLIDYEGEIVFLEINARKQGTTLEFCHTLEQSLPEGSPSLMELEYFAVTEDRFPKNTVELLDNNRNLHWGTYNYKIDTQKRTTGYIPQNTYERETFRKVANGELLKDFAILEHVGTNFYIMPGTFLARVVSVATNREDVDEGLCQGVGFIKQTIEEV
jgi:hypothetical protein